MQFVLDQLSALEGLSSRVMFGGYGLYRNADFFAIVFRSRLYLKTDDTTREKFLAAGCGPFQPSEKQILKNYLEVPAAVLDDRDELVRWSREAAER